MKILFAACALFQNHIDDGGNHFTGFFDDHGVADADVFLADVIFVVQRGAADGAAGKKNRFKFGHGRERAGATDLDGDGFEFGFGLFGRVFVGDGPARRFGRRSDAALLLERIQFDDRTVGFVGEIVTDLVEFGDGGDEIVLGFAKPRSLRCLESERF